MIITARARALPRYGMLVGASRYDRSVSASQRFRTATISQVQFSAAQTHTGHRDHLCIVTKGHYHAQTLSRTIQRACHLHQPMAITSKPGEDVEQVASYVHNKLKCWGIRLLRGVRNSNRECGRTGRNCMSGSADCGRIGWVALTCNTRFLMGVH